MALWEEWEQLLSGEDKSGHCECWITQVAFLNGRLDMAGMKLALHCSGEERWMAWAPYVGSGE